MSHEKENPGALAGATGAAFILLEVFEAYPSYELLAIAEHALSKLRHSACWHMVVRQAPGAY